MDIGTLSVKTEKRLGFLAEPYYFIQFYFILLLIQSLFFVAPDIQNIIHYIFIAWGSLLILYQTVFRKKVAKLRILWVFGASWFLALLTIVLNREAGNVVYSLKTWFLLSLVYLAFFPFFELTKKQKKDALLGVIRPLVVIQFVFALVSILLYIFNVSGYVFRSDTSFYWGVRYIFRDSGTINPLLIGVYNDANYVTVIVFISIVFSLILLAQHDLNKISGFFLCLNIVLEAYIFILANSRAANLALVIVFICWLVIILKKRMSGGSLLNRERVIMGIVLCLSILSLFFGPKIRKASFYFLEKPITRVTVVLPGGVKSIDFDGPDVSDNKWTFLVEKGPLDSHFVGKYYVYFSTPNWKEENPDSSDLADVDKKTYIEKNKNQFDNFSENKEDTSTTDVGDLGNGRIGRWKESIKLVTLHRPLTGTSPRGIQYFAKKYSSDSEPFRRLNEGQHTVSSVLTYLLYYGWPAFLLLMAFGLIIIWRIVQRIFIRKNISFEYILMFGLAVYLLIISIFLSALLEVATYYSCSTLFVLGYLYFEPEQNNAE
jgi:hypothetical protein